MKIKNRKKTAIAAISLIFCIILTQFVFAQETEQQAKPATNRGAFMQFYADPRVEKRTYHFMDTDEELYYNMFVSSKVSKERKNPLIITLHGLGAGPEIMMNKLAIDLAEKGGYILVAPMGYNVSGWYGISMKRFGNMFNRFGNSKEPPENVNELSEKDVMNVLDIVCREFNVDERRIYLMGHSMGGAGTLFLGTKYPLKWAALGPIAPATMHIIEPDILISAVEVPVILIQGDRDNLVPATNTRRWVEKLKELNMTYEYVEMEGGDHGSVIFTGLPKIYEFFEKHSKPE